MADLVVGCVKEIGKYILTQWIQPPVERHVDYWWSFDNNIQGLRNEVGYLDKQIHDLKQEIEGARLRTEILRPWIEEWLILASEKLAEGKRILQDDNIPKAWNITSRYSMGKRAKKTAEEIAEVRNIGKLDRISDRISDPAPPPSTRFSSHGSTMDFESRKHIEENIIQYLRSSSVSMVGICGMGGVGKTTMAERIGEKVKVENLFDEVVKVTVSQKIDKLKIQEEIAEWLGLKLDGNHLATRAAKLRTRLMDTKRKIIILDDVWETLIFEELGIPIERVFERCKVLLTSRSRDTCKRIKNKKVFELKILKEEEAWILFKEQVGECLEDLALGPLAKDVAAECKGLPIALVTVGLALQDEKDERIWEYSLSKLKEAKPTDLPKEIMTHVYGSLELSYEKLDDHLEKRLFLLCCLFPEDYDIRLEELTWYCMGLQMFDDISIEEATNKTHTLVGNLKSRFLLINGRDKLHVKMHDVVRDVAIYIGSKEEEGFLKSLSSIKNSSDDNCNWMSVNISNERMEVPVVLRFPKLRLLMLLKWGCNELFDISFEGMKDVKVLSFQRTSIVSLPPTLGLLKKNLRTLCLFNCEVENISVIGELACLEILCCYECDNIKELPVEIGSLSGLRLLELNRCRKLQRIPFGVISSLRRLEELKMSGSFSRWEAEENGKERRNASLRELEWLRLPNLSCLEIEIDDCTLSAQEICLSQKLVKYYIRIGSVINYYFEADDFRIKPGDHKKVMILNLSGAVGNWIPLLAKNAECLSLRGDGSDNINLAEMENLRNLKFTNCSTVKKLVDAKDGIVFPSLETLRLDELTNLEEICHPNQNVSLCNLKFIHIIGIFNLKHLFSVSVARTRLLQLELLEIKNCTSMEQVFWNEVRNDNTDDCIEFPKLKELRLWNLSNLTAFCEGLENIIIKFPNLTQMDIRRLPKLNSLSFVCNPDCNPKDVWSCNLKSIYIFGCDNLRSLFSVSAARRCLLQLEVLEIEECTAMEHMFWNEGPDDNKDGCIEFPKLKELRLHHLPNLTAFCQGLENIIIKFPNGLEMSIVGLRKLNSLSPLKDVSFCNLKSIYIFQCDNLRSVFSVSEARRLLLQLEVLRIEESDAMEQVFWNEGTCDNTDGCIEFPKLKELKLRCLSNLTAFCQGLENIIIKFPKGLEISFVGLPKLNSLSPLKDVSFCNLKSIYISQCDNLRSLFSVSVARRCLFQLEVLKIEECAAMEQVFWNEGIEDNTDGCIEFPKLKELILRHLPNLTAFCQGLENVIIKFPNGTEMCIIGLRKLNSLSPLKDVSFKSIYIFQCDNLRSLFSVSAARRCFLQLEILEIEECAAMEQVIWNDGTDDNTDGCIDFPKLKMLTLKHLSNLTAFCQGLENIIIKFPKGLEISIVGLPKLNSLRPLNSETVVWHDQNTCFHLFCIPKDVSYCNLKSICIFGCDNLRSVFLVSVAKTSLLQLEVLHIQECAAMEQVFCNEIRYDNTDGCIEFPKLMELKLWDLPNLTAFCQGLENIAIKFPNLTQMRIEALPKLNSLSPLNSETVVWHDQNTCFHLFCNPKVEMSCLKDMRLYSFQDNIMNIWCHQIPNNVFNNLETLLIHSINGIRSLMSTSIAKNLVSLKYLDIMRCKEMVEVIERDDDDDKQVVDISCLFPNLIKLNMRSLHKLIRFWQWNNALELPLLEKVEFYNCPVMKTFTLGSINTPNIKEIEVNDQQVRGKKDLNDVIRHIWIKSQYKSKVSRDGNEN